MMFNVIKLAVKVLTKKEIKFEAYHVEGPKIEIKQNGLNRVFFFFAISAPPLMETTYIKGDGDYDFINYFNTCSITADWIYCTGGQCWRRSICDHIRRCNCMHCVYRVNYQIDKKTEKKVVPKLESRGNLDFGFFFFQI